MTALVDAGHERLPRAARIRRTRDIRVLVRRGTRMRAPALDVYVLDRSAGGAGDSRGPRIGWIVPKLGHGGVERNRLKRRLREIGRRRVLKRLREAEYRGDVLVRARRGGYRATYQQLEAQWMSIVEVACSHR